jgi:hypothetical protein
VFVPPSLHIHAVVELNSTRVYAPRRALWHIRSTTTVTTCNLSPWCYEYEPTLRVSRNMPL